MTGTVTRFKDQKGYGFIQRDDGGDDVFVHFSAIRMPGHRILYEGQQVEFDLAADPKGWRAVDVMPLEGAGAA